MGNLIVPDDFLFRHGQDDLDVEEIAAYFAMRSHASHLATDGFITRDKLAKIGSSKGGSPRRLLRGADKLIVRGIVSEREPGVLHVAHVDEWNRSRSELTQLRVAKQAAGARGGKASAASRGSEGLGQAKAEQTSPAAEPVLNPSTTTSTTTTTSSPATQGVEGVPVLTNPEPKRRREKTAKTRPPLSTASPDEVDAWCRSFGLPPASASADVVAMIDYHRKEGKGSADWAASLRTWIASPFRNAGLQRGAVPIQKAPPREQRAWRPEEDIGGTHGVRDRESSGVDVVADSGGAPVRAMQ